MSFHLFKINELYSSPGGTVQYIELLGMADGQNLLMGHTIHFDYAFDSADFTFPGNLPSTLTLNKTVLLANQAFADLGLVTPDYIIPNQFVSAGTVRFPGAPDDYQSVVFYGDLLHDGTQALYSNGNGGTPGFPLSTVAGDNTPSNFAGVSGFIPGNPIPGTANADLGFGTAGKDYMVGLGGDDTLNGGAGNDTMIGGTGNDTYVRNAAGDVVSELAGQGTDTVQSTVTSTLGANVENLTLTGGAAINGTGNTLANVLTGNTTNNTLTGGNGNDTLNGGTGNDTMVGGAGNDTYVRNAAGDVVSELAGQGTDSVQSSVTYTLAADVENLVLTGTGNTNGTGNARVNVLTGNSGANVLDGMGGADTLNGLDGNDTLIWSAGDALVDGGVGTDALRLTGGNLNLTTVVNTAVLNTEITNMTGVGNNVLTLNRADVLDISSTTNTLKVLGDAGDSINIVGSFTDLGLAGTFHKYALGGGAVLLVDIDITNVA